MKTKLPKPPKRYKGIKSFTALMNYISATAPRGFTREPLYNKAGDFIDVFWQDVATYSEYVNLELSIHRSMENHEIVGVQINGIKGLLRVK